jgi:hypothetical protein
MLTIKGELTKEKLIDLLKIEVCRELNLNAADFDIENLRAEDIYENTCTSDFNLTFTVKKK